MVSLAVVLFAIIACAGGIVYLCRHRRQMCVQTLQRIYFKTDGVVKPEWILRRYPLKRGMPLMDVDILQFKERLESVDQVRSAQVNRRFPDAIEINLTERRPVARVGVRWKGVNRVFVVDDGGNVFESYFYDDHALQALPWLLDFTLKIHENRWQPIPHFHEIISLLQALRTALPELMPTILGVSLRNLDVAAVPWSSITLCLKGSKVIVFSPMDLQSQINRLGTVLRSIGPNDWKNLQSIDMSLTSPVLKFKNKYKPRR
jgi:hypothetical protein